MTQRVPSRCGQWKTILPSPLGSSNLTAEQPLPLLFAMIPYLPVLRTGIDVSTERKAADGERKPDYGRTLLTVG